MSDLHDWIAQSVALHERPLLAYAGRLLRDEHRARDVVQETFLRLLDQRPEALDGHLAPWLFTVCRRCALDVLRKEHRMASVDEQVLATFPDAKAPPEAQAGVQDEHDRVLKALHTLPPEQEEAIRLKFHQGFSYREISAVMDKPLGTVSALIHHGLKALRLRLGVGSV